MFGGNRVIWVSAAGDNLAKSLDPILANEAGGNLILIDAEALSKTSRLRKLFETHPLAASVALYEESPQELRLRLERLIKSSGLAIDEEAMLRLLEFMSFERAVAESETSSSLPTARAKQQYRLKMSGTAAIPGCLHG
jgi:DNA polymerase III delta subunit